MQKGLRQFDVAKQVDISESYLSKIETGRVLPKLEILEGIASVLGVPTAELDVAIGEQVKPLTEANYGGDR